VGLQKASEIVGTLRRGRSLKKIPRNSNKRSEKRKGETKKKNDWLQGQRKTRKVVTSGIRCSFKKLPSASGKRGEKGSGKPPSIDGRGMQELLHGIGEGKVEQ